MKYFFFILLIGCSSPKTPNNYPVCIIVPRDKQPTLKINCQQGVDLYVESNGDAFILVRASNVHVIEHK